MCNLYKLRRATAEVAALFAAEADPAANLGEEVYPGYPWLVVTAGRLRTMTWGFPLVLTGKAGQRLRPKPVNNAREDKLGTPFWRDSFRQRRCLIPLTAWAEAEGERGRMTRTWYGLAGQATFAVAGLWRPTEPWGDCFAMVMVDGCAQMAEVHDRMPVVLAPADHAAWLDGTPAEALALCRPATVPLTVDRTAEPWATPRAGRPAAPPPPLLL